MWRGARTGNTTQQAYYTSPRLAKRFLEIATRYGRAPFAELGVGEGALFKNLPLPKFGVEIDIQISPLHTSG